ncbi:MAG TPA: protease HtpX [Rhodospirillaceae bacterium]|nr:protease HtpX [Rhodospirillaceae bacterium]
MKRILLFIATNLAVVLVLGVVASLLGVNQYLVGSGINFVSLLIFASLMGFGGAFISLWMSKSIAKLSTGAQVITHPQTPEEKWLIATVRKLSLDARLPMPDVAIFEGNPNAFATGASEESSLVAVSTGLLQSMNKDEVEAVLAHEVSHIANGDMVTLTLIQGVVNTFVFFLARVVGYVIDSAMRKGNAAGHSASPGVGYMATSFIGELVFGVLASLIVMYFSRQREFKADSGAAQLLGSPLPMIAALRRLGATQAGALPANMASSGIAGGGGRKFLSLFATHPSLEERIAALKASHSA